MALAHTCPTCGCELSRLAAPLDPVYRLPIVVCPGCREPSVRRSDGARAVPREASRVLQAAWRLVRRLAVLGVFSAGFVAAGIMLQTSLDMYRLPLFEAIEGLLVGQTEGRIGSWRGEFGTIALVIWLVIGAGAGAYLVAASGGRSRRRVVVLWFAVTLLAALLPAAAVLSLEIGRSGYVPSARTQVRMIPMELEWWARHAYQVVIAMPAAMVLGLPPGLIVRRRRAGASSRRFRRLRKRLTDRRHRS